MIGVLIARHPFLRLAVSAPQRRLRPTWAAPTPTTRPIPSSPSNIRWRRRLGTNSPCTRTTHSWKNTRTPIPHPPMPRMNTVSLSSIQRLRPISIFRRSWHRCLNIPFRHSFPNYPSPLLRAKAPRHTHSAPFSHTRDQHIIGPPATLPVPLDMVFYLATGVTP